MAKGDHERVENMIKDKGKYASDNLDNLRSSVSRQTGGLEQAYNLAQETQRQDYTDLMDRFKSFQPSYGAYDQYSDFAKTGGYSPQNIQDIRARSISPLRAVYAQAQTNLNRNRALQGGYSPNYAAASAKMSRELGQGLSDASTNVEAALAESIRSGKLAGMSGMTGIDQSRNAQLLQALSGGTQLYGTTPAQTNMYGNQMLKSRDQQLQTQQLTQALAEMMINGTLGMSGVKGNFASAMDNVMAGLNPIKSVATGIGSMY